MAHQETRRRRLFSRFLKRVRTGALWCGGGVLALAAAGTWVFVKADDSLDVDLSRRSVTDITGLYRTQVGRVETPRTTEEVARFLRETKGSVSIGGARCSMGGQIAEPGSLHLDMRAFREVISFSPEARTVTVQAGITWRDLQDRIDPEDLSVKIMQTYSNFTVGGSLSVNAHGRYMGRGPIAQSVRSLVLVLADGRVMRASPSENAELFYGALGGYGALGVITEATLDLVPNGKVQRQSETLATREYANFFREKVRDNSSIVFHNADLHPPSFETARVVSWVETNAEPTDPERLIPRGQKYSWTPRLVNGTPSFPFGYALRRHVLEPIFYAREVITFRNHEASYDIAELEPVDRKDETFVLREYFVPAESFDDFVPKMRKIFLRHQVPVINISVRHASADPGTLLAWARGETFAFVVYYRQGTSDAAVHTVGEWSREMIDAVLEVGGTYYLPYQNHATAEQFRKAYPRAPEFFELKRRVDPELRFQNSLLYAYGPSPRAERDANLQAVGYRKKPEGQSLLTVPEWYLVWNPLEYADHLARGGAPDQFPWFASVEEYASLYKKVLRASQGVYPVSDEYLTMLRVIGVSTAVEYLLKGTYESSIGRLFRAFSSGESSTEEKIIAGAARAYAQFIFDEPWYEFAFAPWVRRIWMETPLQGPDFLRRTERKFAFSVEYLVKAAYATVLGWAAGTAYGPAEEHIDIVVRPSNTAPLPNSVRERALLPEGERVLELERWKEFSEDVPRLAAAGFEFVEIAGNDDIVVSVVEDSSQRVRSARAQRLFVSRIVSDQDKRRGVWLVPVAELTAFLGEVRDEGARVEHLYDY